jgi:hypothetical protein
MPDRYNKHDIITQLITDKKCDGTKSSQEYAMKQHKHKVDDITNITEKITLNHFFL